MGENLAGNLLTDALIEAHAETPWAQADAIALAVKVNRHLPGDANCHVALTGGCLYKEGRRKDCDLLFYRVRQVDQLNKTLLGEMLEDIGFSLGTDHGWVWKATYAGKDVDLFFPDHETGEYVP